ncbi:MAG: glycosyltransferase family 2 protein [bacterium]
MAEMKDDKKSISIILVSYENPGILMQCIKSILKEANKPNESFEIIVVDNSINNKNRNEIKEKIEDDFSKEVKLIKNKKNVGFPKAVNQGIKNSSGKYVLILNPDITVLENSINKLAAFLDQHEEVAIVSPKLVNPKGTIQFSCFSFFTTIKTIIYRRTSLGNLNKGKKNLEKFSLTNWNHAEARPVAWMLGSAMMAKREAIKKVGLMDERFFMYMEDVDWCRRFWRAGYKVYYYPDAAMVHYYQRESATESSLFLAMFNKLTRIHIKSAIKYFWKYRRAEERDLINKINNLNSNEN